MTQKLQKLNMYRCKLRSKNMRTTLKLLDEFENNISLFIVKEDKVIFKKALNAVEEIEMTKQEAIKLLNEIIDLIDEESE